MGSSDSAQTSLDESRIKDLRTSVEISGTQKVLDGDLDAFIEASLKQGV
jgi:peptide chain release factor 2